MQLLGASALTHPLTPSFLSHLTPNQWTNYTGSIVNTEPECGWRQSSVVAYLSNDWGSGANCRSNGHEKKRFKTSYRVFHRSLLPRPLSCAMADLTSPLPPSGPTVPFHLIKDPINSTGECHVLLKTTTVCSIWEWHPFPCDSTTLHGPDQDCCSICSCALLLRTSLASFHPYSKLFLKNAWRLTIFTLPITRLILFPQIHTHKVDSVPLFRSLFKFYFPESLPESLHRMPSPIIFYPEFINGYPIILSAFLLN